MAQKRHSPGCPCCKDCSIRSDNFDSDTSASYTQQSGTWPISDGLMSTEDADALLSINQAHTSPEHTLEIDLRGTAEGDQLGGVVAYLDADNFLYALVTFGECGILQLWEVVDGTHSQLGVDVAVDAPLNEFVRLRVCHAPATYPAPGLLQAVVGNRYYGQETDNGLGNQAGLLTRDLTGTASFDRLRFRIHEPGCPRCNKPTDCTIWDEANPDADDCHWDANGINKLLIPNPSNLSSGFVWVEFTADAVGDSASAHIDVDGSDSHKATLTVGAQDGTLAVFKGTSQLGNSVTVPGAKPNEPLRVVVCLDGSGAVSGTAAVGGELHHTGARHSEPFGGVHAGFATSGSVSVTRFFWSQMQSQEFPDCLSPCAEPAACVACVDDEGPADFLLYGGIFEEGQDCTQEECDEPAEPRIVPNDAPCRWLAFGNNGCTDYSQLIEIHQEEEGGGWAITVELRMPLFTAFRQLWRWRQIYDEKPDCKNLQDEEIPFLDFSNTATFNDTKCLAPAGGSGSVFLTAIT